jgi:hypothetical protein
MGLPSSGQLAASTIGGYVFDRGATTEFSLSASLAGTTVNKGYTTTLGPLWRGTGDVNNQQYNQGANNFSISDWYSYYKGFELSTLTPTYPTPEDACQKAATEGVVYVTDSFYYSGPGGATIVNDQTIGYSNTSGTTLYPDTNDQWLVILEMNAAYTINASGLFSNEYPCA